MSRARYTIRFHGQGHYRFWRITWVQAYQSIEGEKYVQMEATTDSLEAACDWICSHDWRWIATHFAPGSGYTNSRDIHL